MIQATELNHQDLVLSLSLKCKVFQYCISSLLFLLFKVTFHLLITFEYSIPLQFFSVNWADFIALYHSIPVKLVHGQAMGDTISAFPTSRMVLIPGS